LKFWAYLISCSSAEKRDNFKMGMHDVEINELIEKAAQELKKHIKQPEWSLFVKTGSGKERPPTQKDWWYLRSASILRKLYTLGPIGVSKLKTKYGNKKNRGHKPERFRKGSGKIIRTILQQLEEAGFVEKKDKTKRKGRVLTAKGKSFLDKINKTQL